VARISSGGGAASHGTPLIKLATKTNIFIDPSRMMPAPYPPNKLILPPFTGFCSKSNIQILCNSPDLYCKDHVNS
jgi:hypothetical protein